MADPKYKEDFHELLFQTDNLFHNRINILLLAETIFFVGATTARSDWPLVIILAALGIATALLCTFTNLKLYWRLHWMIEEYRKHSAVFEAFATYENVDKGRYGRLTRWLLNKIKPPGEKKAKVWIGTGWLFTWGFFWVIVVGWVSLMLLSIFGKRS